MIEAKALIQRAIDVLNPRRLSPSVEVGGVASALVTASGNIYTGVCIDAACSLGFCAEANAVGSMVTHGESRIVSIVAVNQDRKIIPPCGRCRELIWQLDERNIETRFLLENERVKTLPELLPEHWLQ